MATDNEIAAARCIGLTEGDPIEVIVYQEPDGSCVITARTRAKVTRMLTDVFLSASDHPEELIQEEGVKAATQLRDKLLEMLPRQNFQ